MISSLKQWKEARINSATPSCLTDQIKQVFELEILKYESILEGKFHELISFSFVLMLCQFNPPTVLKKLGHLDTYPVSAFTSLFCVVSGTDGLMGQMGVFIKSGLFFVLCMVLFYEQHEVTHLQDHSTIFKL